MTQNLHPTSLALYLFANEMAQPTDMFSLIKTAR